MKRQRSKYARTRREISKLLSNKNVVCKMQLGELYSQLLRAEGGAK